MHGDNEVDDWFEQELAEAPRTLTANLYHYTSVDTAIGYILASRTLRLSPFQGTNDLWESRPLWPNLEGASSVENQQPESTVGMWEDIDRFIRGYSKVACFTQDWALPSSVLNPDSLRGWSHLAMWAHYGAHHTGVCLRFEKDLLLAAFDGAGADATHQFSGPVNYRAAESGSGPHGISIEQVEEFGIDAVALRYASIHRNRVFFRKHVDWAAESEFRLVRTDLSHDPFYLDISRALTGVVLGDAFPMDRLPELRSTLGGFDGVALYKMTFHNRSIHLFPVDDTTGRATPEETADPDSPVARPRRNGDLTARRDALDQVESEAAEARALAMSVAEPIIQGWRNRLVDRQALFDSWPHVIVTVYPSGTAIPAGRRARRPGVPTTDAVDYESGLMVVGENQPQYSWTFVAAVAIQVLSTGALRFHAVITLEEWRPSGNETYEEWRYERDVNRAEAVEEAARVMDELAGVLPSAQARFDQLRGS